MSETKYPLLEVEGNGWRVRTGPGGYLPGIYLNHLLAKKAMLRYLGGLAEAKRNRKSRTQKDK